MRQFAIPQHDRTYEILSAATSSKRSASLFSKDGLLSKAKNFEYRPQQQEMAVAVARALEEERHLVVEAGTASANRSPTSRPPFFTRSRRKRRR